jgi:hypothetical protein
MRHNPAYGIMAKLMKTGTIIINLIPKCGLRRHLDIIERRNIKGFGASRPKVGACVFYEFVRVRYSFAFG